MRKSDIRQGMNKPSGTVRNGGTSGTFSTTDTSFEIVYFEPPFPAKRLERLERSEAVERLERPQYQVSVAVERLERFE